MKKLFCPKCKKDKRSTVDFFHKKNLDLASKKSHNQSICIQCDEKQQKVDKNLLKPL
jgi:hypothetical protein